MSRKISRDFHQTLQDHLLGSRIPLAVIATHSGISRRTLHRWFENTLPKNPLVLLKVLAFIHLPERETDKLLQLAGFPTLKELQRTNATTQDRAILQTWSTRPAPNQSLPSPNYFVGRRELIEEIKRSLLGSNGLKLVGLRGLGGAGKTTLAKRLAEALESDFPDGILWGELHQSDTEAILTQFAGDYGEDLTQYSGLASKASLVRSLLRRKRALIVLDNADSDEQLKYLLPPKASACGILITSRKNLKTLRNWASFEIKGFDPQESLLLFQVFLGKTKVARYESILTQIAEQLGHLPLAIVILASYLQFHPEQDIEQLPETFQNRLARMNLLHAEEDESVRITFELSWDKLSPDEQQSLALLSQFGGRNFSTEAAAAVWGDVPRSAKRCLANFADLSLIEPNQSERWGLHPLIYDFLTEKMESHYPEQSQPVTQRLVEYFTTAIQNSGTAGYRHLKLDLDNIIQALNNSYNYQLWDLLASGAPFALNLLETFGRYEAIDHLADRALLAAERLEDDPALAALLYCLATIDVDGHMNYARAIERAQLGLTLARNVGDWALACEFNFILARVAWTQGDASLEKQYWAEIEKLAKPRHLSDILMRLAEARAWRALWFGDYAFAEKTLTQFIQYSQRKKKTTLLWKAHDYLAYVFYRKGDFERADVHYQKALDVAFEADGLLPVTVLLGRAQNAVGWGKLDSAQMYANQALDLSKSVARPLDIFDANMYGGDVAFACADYPRARELWMTALQISQATHAHAKECAALARLGQLQMVEGNLLQAEKLLQQALQVSSQFREPSYSPRSFVYEQLAYLAAKKGQIPQAKMYGEKCLEVYDQMRLREAVTVRKWLSSLSET